MTSFQLVPDCTHSTESARRQAVKRETDREKTCNQETWQISVKDKTSPSWAYVQHVSRNKTQSYNFCSSLHSWLV